MSTIERISAPGSVRRALKPRTFFVALLAAAALCGCARHSDIWLTNGGRITDVRQVRKSNEGGSYTFITADGKTNTVSAGRVINIVPHGETNGIFDN